MTAEFLSTLRYIRGYKIELNAGQGLGVRYVYYITIPFARVMIASVFWEDIFYRRKSLTVMGVQSSTSNKLETRTSADLFDNSALVSSVII